MKSSHSVRWLPVVFRWSLVLVLGLDIHSRERASQRSDHQTGISNAQIAQKEHIVQFSNSQSGIKQQQELVIAELTQQSHARI